MEGSGAFLGRCQSGCPQPTFHSSSFCPHLSPSYKENSLYLAGVIKAKAPQPHPLLGRL